MSVFVHPQALCESTTIGDGTRVWAFAHVLAGARIGRDCNICDHVFIENDVIVGDRVTVKCGVQLWNGLRVEDDVFIGPNATFTNDPFPRSRRHRPALETRICRGASLSANCTVLPGLTVGSDAMIGAGAVVTYNVPARAIVAGNPARIMGYVDAARPAIPEITAGGTYGLASGVRLQRFQAHTDLRGSVTAGEFGEQVPFIPKRFFMIHDVPGKEVRGEHAHRTCHQFLICVSGSLIVLSDDGRHREEIVLESRGSGLYVPAMTWTVHWRYSPDSVLLVFASEPYDPNDYIRDYEAFKRLKLAEPVG